MLHISCNIGTCDLPDMYALRPVALGLWAYISGKSLVPMLQLLLIAQNNLVISQAVTKLLYSKVLKPT